MKKETKIYIAGHRGMVGSAVWRTLESKGYSNLIGKTSAELDLKNQQAVTNFYKKEQPEMVIDAAAKVGGILEHDLVSLVKDMMESDIRLFKKDQYLNEGGYTTLNDFNKNI